jgi:acyl-CoA reductase-like NAD-dependent aldehyde dehydrogenase
VALDFIDGVWREAATGAVFERRTPYDGELVDTYADSDEEDVAEAVRAARRAFDEGPWPRLPAAERAAVLRRAATLIRERIDEFTTVMTREIGQPGQRGAALAEADQLDYYAGLVVSRRDAAVYDQHPDAVGLVGHDPVGVVGVLTAWNAPLSVGHKGCPALAAGCTLVVKPGHQASGATVLLAEVLAEAGLPAGAFNLVTSATANGAVVGQAIAASPGVDMVSFTGSAHTGREVMRTAAGTLKRVNLELGGKSPNVVFADAPDLDRVAAAVAKGIVRLTGQSCQAGSRLLVQEPVKEELLARVLEHLGRTRLGDPFAAGTTAGPLISADQRERVVRYVEAGHAAGRLVHGGGVPADEALRAGHFYEPTVFDDVDPGSALAREEVFGPVLATMTFRDLDDAVRLANDTAFGLAAGVWSRDLSTAMRFARGARSGVVWVNGFRDDSVLRHLPMGGYKQSGVGREWGPEGLDVFLEPKSIMITI